MDTEIVVVTGASGFLGQHLVSQLIKNDCHVQEIRTIDLDQVLPVKSSEDDVHISAGKKLQHFIGDLSNLQDLPLDTIFYGVTTIFHCAAYVSYSEVLNEEFERNNITATKNIIDICLRFDVNRLIFTSTSEVAMRSYYFKHGFFSLIINQTEQTEKSEHQLIVGSYAKSKLIAEKLVLAANQELSKSGVRLKTIALRPTFLYGPGDKFLIPTILRWTQQYFHGYFPQISYLPGLLQLTYVENASWAHIVAKNMLKSDQENISGLPVFITDETPTGDLLKFCDNFIKRKPLQFISFIPFFLVYFLTTIWSFLENLLSMTNQIEKHRCCPRILTSILGSVAHFNSLRAKIHLKYKPVVPYEDAIKKSKDYYNNLIVSKGGK